MKRKLALFLCIIMVTLPVLTACSGGTEEPVSNELPSSENQPVDDTDTNMGNTTAEESLNSQIGFNTDFEITEGDREAIMSSDVGVEAFYSSPFYFPEVYKNRFNDPMLMSNRDIIIEEILNGADRIKAAADAIESEMVDYQALNLTLMDIYLDADLEQAYIYGKANAYANYSQEEIWKSAQVNSIEFDGYKGFENGWFAYEYVLESLNLGVLYAQHIESYAYDSSVLIYNAERVESLKVKEAIAALDVEVLLLQESLEPKLGTLMDAIHETYSSLQKLEDVDHQLSMAIFSYVKSEVPKVTEALMRIENDEILDADEKDLIKAMLEDILTTVETFEESLEAATNTNIHVTQEEMAIYVKSDLEEVGLLSALLPVAYADDADLLAMSKAHYTRAQLALASSKTMSTMAWGSGFFSSIKNSVSKMGSSMGNTFGSALEVINTGVKNTLDVGYGLYYDVPLDDISNTLEKNMKTMKNNFKNGVAGAVVFENSNEFIKDVEEKAGKLSEKTFGKGLTTSTIDTASKFIIGSFTGLAKGVYAVSNPKSTSSEVLNGAFDIGLSFVNWTKFVSGCGSTIKNLAKTGLNKVVSSKFGQTIVKTGAKYISKLTKAGPKLFSKITNSNIVTKMKGVVSKTVDYAKRVGTKAKDFMTKKVDQLTTKAKVYADKAKNWLSDSAKNNGLVGKVTKKIQSVGNKVSELYNSGVDLFKDAVGANRDEIVKNYASNEVANVIKEGVGFVEDAIDENQAQSQHLNSLVKEVQMMNDNLPTANHIEKVIENMANMEVTANIEDDESSDEINETDETSDEEIITEETETENVDNEVIEETTEEADTETEIETDTETESSNDTAVAFEGTYVGYGIGVRIPEAPAGQNEYPLSSGNSKLKATIYSDGYVNNVISVFGTGMMDMDADLTSSAPAQFDGNSITYSMVDDEGDTSVVSATISGDVMKGTISMYDGGSVAVIVEFEATLQ